MPRRNGVEFSLVCLSNLGTFPEFPHPDNTQWTNCSQDGVDGGKCQSEISDIESDATTDAATDGSSEEGSDAEFLGSNHAVKSDKVVGKELVVHVPGPKPIAKVESKADSVLGRPTAISVYIPAVPDTRWWLKYRIHDEAEHDLFYFKLSVNGREVMSWGHDAAKNPSGQVSRAFFDPSEKYVYEDKDGMRYKKCGLERRAFYFIHPRAGSVAADGGLIQIRAYRALGRVRCVQDPPVHKNQKDYGIFFRSAGLMDDASDAKFYKWLLKDRIDKPHTTFKFHYRSWETLQLLQIVPDDFSRAFIPPTKSTLDLYGLSLATQELLDEKHFEAYEKEDEERRERDIARKLARAKIKPPSRMARVYLPRDYAKVDRTDEEEGWEYYEEEDEEEKEEDVDSDGDEDDETSLDSPRTVVPADYQSMMDQDDLKNPTLADRPGTPFESTRDEGMSNFPGLVNHNEGSSDDEVAPKKMLPYAPSSNSHPPVLLKFPTKLRAARPSYHRSQTPGAGTTNVLLSPMQKYQESKAAAWLENAEKSSNTDLTLSQRPLPRLPVRGSSLQNQNLALRPPLLRAQSAGHKLKTSSGSHSDGEATTHASSFVHQRKRSGSLDVTLGNARNNQHRVCKHKKGSDNLSQSYAVRGPRGNSPAEDHGFHFFDVPSEYQPRAEDLPPWQTGNSDSDSDLSDIEYPPQSSSNYEPAALPRSPKVYAPTGIPMSKFNGFDKKKTKSAPSRISSDQGRPSLTLNTASAIAALEPRTSTSTGRRTPITPGKSPKSMGGFRRSLKNMLGKKSGSGPNSAATSPTDEFF